MGLFQGVLDRYNGVTIDLEDETCETHDFSVRLKNSIAKWNEENKRCIWFKVPIKEAALVPLLANATQQKSDQSEGVFLCTCCMSADRVYGPAGVIHPILCCHSLYEPVQSRITFLFEKEGFNFHHARDSFVMMYKWLPVHSTPNLPPASHTNLGVGGLVFKNNKEILVVAEQHLNYPHWKLPGGYVERGEDIVNAAIREVKEETDVDCVFESMVTLRHTHDMAFGNSDVYVVLMLRAITEDIVKSNDEIRDCKWMDVAEFLNHPHVHEFNRFIVRQAIDLREKNIKLDLPKSTIKFSTWSRDITSLVFGDLIQG